MMKAETLFINAIEHWRLARGIGTAIIPAPLDDKVIILGILQKLYEKDKETRTLIITNNFYEREQIIEYITNQQNQDENNTEFKRLLDEKYIKIFTTKLIENPNFNMRPYFTVIYRPDAISPNIVNLLNNSKYKLVVLNKLSISVENCSKLYSVCPLLDDFKQHEIDLLRTSSPVEEKRIGITLPTDSEDYKLLQYYTEYITTSINIFGSFDNIQLARTGDYTINVSATQFCYKLAHENGWNANLDMSIPLNVQLDELYNPTAIRERASQVYDMTRNRQRLLASNELKLEQILEIVKEHEDEHILIINKFPDFAAKVTEYLNNMSETDICGNYHDKVNPIPASTIYGEPIYIKSGKNKGERRMIAATAQKQYNETRFNHGLINVLSTNNAPDKNLNIPVDVIIITSPECEEIEAYIYRLSNVTYPKGMIKLYTLYIKDSIEEKRLETKTLSENHTLLTNVKNEENCSFVLIN